jgi:hypothetical protein
VTAPKPKPKPRSRAKPPTDPPTLPPEPSAEERAATYSKLGQILDRAALASLPKPEPLIYGWLDLRTTVVVIGETGTNKTFTILGWACSVATGEPWLGHAVEIAPSPVIVVAGEGGGGIDGRIAAWETAAGVAVPPDKLAVLLRPESLLDPEFWSQLTDLARTTGARFVAFDTFSSLAPEADETKDPAKVLRRMSDLAAAIDGTVLLAHHTGGANKNRARGGSQLEANPDNVIVLQKSDPEAASSAVSILRKKDKEGESGLRLWVERSVVGTSCVLSVTETPVVTNGGVSVDLEQAALRAVDDADPFTYTQTGLGSALGGNHEKARQAVQNLLDAGVLETRRATAPEGVTGKRVERVRLGRPEQPRPATDPEEA